MAQFPHDKPAVVDGIWYGMISQSGAMPWLDGKPITQHKPFNCDPDEGWVDCYERDSEGQYVITPFIDVRTIRVHGRVTWHSLADGRPMTVRTPVSTDVRWPPK